MGVSMNEDEEIDNELDWFLSEQTWEEYFNDAYANEIAYLLEDKAHDIRGDLENGQTST